MLQPNQKVIRGPLGTRRDAQAALRAGTRPGNCVLRPRLSHREPAQTVRCRLRVGAAKAQVINHWTHVETSSARCAQGREFRPRFSQEVFRRLCARRLQLGHLRNVRRTSHLVKSPLVVWGPMTTADPGFCTARRLIGRSSLARAWNLSGWVRLWLGEPQVAIDHAAGAMRLSPLDRAARIAQEGRLSDQSENSRIPVGPRA
jgi:hypothetical protein